MEKINILGIDYKIEYVNIISKECLTLGQIDYLNQEIKILDELEDDIKKVTLIHEILHGIFNQLGFEDEAADEHLINSLATALYQILRQIEK